jgi:hypothetical protein
MNKPAKAVEKINAKEKAAIDKIVLILIANLLSRITTKKKMF